MARVNDYAGLLSVAERQRLESLLAERERATGAQVVVAVFPSLEGESLEDFSIRLAQRWRIGQKGLDNGAILLVFARERRVRLEVGYGLEPVVPDAVAGQIIRETIGPRFREGRYADGLEAAARALYDRVGRDSERRAPARPSRPGTSPLMLWGFLVLVVVIAAMLIQEAASARRFVRRNGYTAGRGGGWSSPVIVPPVFWGGGGGGGGGGFSGGGGSFGGGGASGGW